MILWADSTSSCVSPTVPTVSLSFLLLFIFPYNLRNNYPAHSLAHFLTSIISLLASRPPSPPTLSLPHYIITTPSSRRCNRISTELPKQDPYPRRVNYQMKKQLGSGYRFEKCIGMRNLCRMNVSVRVSCRSYHEILDRPVWSVIG